MKKHFGKIAAELKGESVYGILMHSPKAMLDEDKTKMRNTKQNFDKEEEAEKSAYRMKDGNLYIPSTAIMGCIINAAAYKKSGKNAVRPLLAGGMRIEPEEISLGVKDYEIDSRPVRIQRDRIIRHRPRIKDWKIKFDIVYNKNIIPFPEKVILPCLIEGGERVGLLDFSPRNKGPFGTFEVSKFEVKE